MKVTFLLRPITSAVMCLVLQVHHFA